MGIFFQDAIILVNYVETALNTVYVLSTDFPGLSRLSGLRPEHSPGILASPMVESPPAVAAVALSPVATDRCSFPGGIGPGFRPLRPPWQESQHLQCTRLTQSDLRRCGLPQRLSRGAKCRGIKVLGGKF